MAIHLSWREKRESARYTDVPDDYIPTTLNDWACLMKYNPKAFNRACVLRDAADREKKRMKKLVAAAECGIVNLAAGVKDPTKWWVCKHEELPEPSTAEQLIIDELVQYPVEWYREVEFNGLKLSEYGYARFDIWMPAINVIVEYDGKWAHSKPEQLAKDNLKSRFCKDNGIRIERWSAKHYYHIPKHVKELLDEYKIKKKR